MKLTTTYAGSETPFESDRTLVWRSLPANARVTKAIVKLTPAQSATGEMFEEIITFADGQGSWGATKTTGTEFVEVDFHARRTLASVIGKNITEVVAGTPRSHLQVDLGGGVYVEINDNGALRSPNDALFSLKSDGKLPSLKVNKLKFSQAPNNNAPLDVTQVTIRSVPTNVNVRLGNLPPFWTHLGELTGEDASPDFAAVLQAFLTEAKAENGFYHIPLTVHSDTIARLIIELEIEYLVEASVMPQGLNEVLLPYDFGSLPKAQENVLQLAVPQNMRVAPKGVAARVRGAFEETRIVYGPTGAVTPSGTVDISPVVSQAQRISLTEALKAAAFDLYMVVTQAAKLQLDLREDLDGKPGGVSLLPGPVKFELPAPVGTVQDRKAAGELRWVSVALPAEFQFQKDSEEDPHRYWLVLQCLEGRTTWNATPAVAGRVGMQHTKDGGLSWRETVAAGIFGPVSAFFRLRQKPERFETPIELQVGTGEQAIRVSLDRFQPLGRVDFALDFDEVGQAFNQYLDKVAIVACPETEHIVNGDFEQWLRVGDKLTSPTPVPLDMNPAAIAISPDGLWAYAAGDISEKGALATIDVVCAKKANEVQLSLSTLNALVVAPDGARAYVTDGQMLQLFDLDTHKELGAPLPLHDGATALALSPDGGRLYVAVYFYASPNFAGSILTIDTMRLEQAVIKGTLELKDVIVGTPPDFENLKPMALAVSPDGLHLYVVISKGAGVNGLVKVFDTDALEGTTAPEPIWSSDVGQEPKAIAITPDGKWAVVANAGSNDVRTIDTKSLTVAGSVTLNHSPVAIAIAPDSMKAYVASGSGNSGSIIDLTKCSVVGPIDVNAPQTALALTPQGDRIYVITTDSNNNSLASIQIGTRLPTEWNLTSGWVAPDCRPDPFHLVAVLGQPRETGEQRKVAAMPSALSQTVPVAEVCPYEFSFWGIASEPDAVAEVMWIGKDCGLLRTDQVPMQVLEAKQSSEILAVAANIRCFGDQDPQLVLHRKRLLAPAGAQQAEVRFTTPIGVCVAIDLVSLIATNEAVANADLSLQQEGQLVGWNLLSTAVSGVTLLAAEGGIQLRNVGAETAELVQVIPVGSDQPFNLEFLGRSISQPSAKDNPRIELRWLMLDQSPAGPSVVLEVLPAGLDSVLASGVSPGAASEAELHLVAPPGTLLEIKRVSLRFSAATSVPVTFIAQAPGELTVSNWRVALERVEAVVPRIPEKGLCTPTPPGRQPGETRNDCCFCPCCKSERIMTDTAPTVTQARRPAMVGHCATCGVELVRFSGARVSSTQSFSLRRLPVRRPIVITTRAATATREQSNARVAAMTPLTALPGIGEVRARRLAESGIDSLEKLAAAAPEDVARVLRRAGVAAQYAARFIEEAKRLLASGKAP